MKCPKPPFVLKANPWHIVLVAVFFGFFSFPILSYSGPTYFLLYLILIVLPLLFWASTPRLYVSERGIKYRICGVITSGMAFADMQSVEYQISRSEGGGSFFKISGMVNGRKKNIRIFHYHFTLRDFSILVRTIEQEAPGVTLEDYVRKCAYQVKENPDIIEKIWGA